MSRLVIEISQLAKWPGRLTGIPRTMEELSSRFAKEGAIFIDWDPYHKFFYQVDYPAAMAKRPEVFRQDEVLDPKKPFVKRAASALEKRSSLAAHGFGVARKGLHRYRMSKTAAEYRNKRYLPQNGDTIFIAWGEAIDNHYTDELFNLNERGASLVHLVHDMIPVVVPQFAGHTTKALQRYATKIYPKCSLLFANSQNTKNDLVQWFVSAGLKPVRTEVIRLGDDFNFANSELPREQAFSESGLKGGDYLLAVGTIEARKNHALLYYTYKLASQRGIDLPKLVIVGRLGWKTSELYEFMTNDPEVKSKFIFLHHVSDEELSWLYGHCLFSLYVSFYEGWGLPIAESIMRDVPCISSNTSSMPEVADGLASAYVSPASTDECLEAIVSLLQPGKVVAERKRIASYKPYRWDQTFASINKYLGDLYGK